MISDLTDSGFIFFFFQAEDGIRDYKVTGVQTCALLICRRLRLPAEHAGHLPVAAGSLSRLRPRGAADRDSLGAWRGEDHGARVDLVAQIGRASCRERV